MSTQEKKAQPLRELVLDLTQACPLMCAHCSSNSTPHAATALPPAVVIRVLRESAMLGLERLAIGGGEPTIADTFWTALEEGEALGLRLKVYTAGVRFEEDSRGAVPFSEEFIKSLVGVPKLVVVFSVYAADVSIHDIITGRPGSLQILQESLRKCLVAGVAAEFHFVPMRPNWRELPQVVSLARQLGIRRVSILRFVPQGRGARSRQWLDLTPAENAELARCVTMCRTEVPEVTIRTGAPFNDLLPGNNVPCRIGIDKLIVQPNGDVVPCEAFKRYPLAQWGTNVHKMSIEGIWKMLSTPRLLHPLLGEGTSGHACPAQYLLRHGGSTVPIPIIALSQAA